VTRAFDIAAQVIAWAAGIATVAALPFAAAGYARQWPVSYRRAMSWLLTVLGILLAVGAAGWLIAGHLPLRKQGLIIAGAGAAGVLLAIAGAIRAVRTPVDPAVRVLRALAGVFERQLNRLDDGTGFDRRRFVPLAVGIASADRSHRTVSLYQALSASSAQVLVLTGESGAGKSVLLREFARETYSRIQRKRRPKRFAVYVDMASFPDVTAEEITADLIRAHVKALTAGDTELTAELDRHLRAPSDRPEWLFLFDSFDELPALSDGKATDVAARQYLDAIRQVLSSGGPTFRAVIATRDPSNLSLAGPVLMVAPLSPLQQREIGRNAGLDPSSWRRLQRRLRHDPTLRPVTSNPLLLSLLSDYLRNADLPEIPPTLHEIVGAAVEARIRSVADPVESLEFMSRAERIARCMIGGMRFQITAPTRAVFPGPARTDAMDGDSDEAVMRLLIEARIGRAERSGRFAFTHRRFEEYFAARWLLLCWDQSNADGLISDPRWREPVITALEIGPAQLRADLISAAARVLDKQTALAAGTLSALEPLIALGPKEPMPPAATSFSWPPVALHILRLLASGLSGRIDEVPADVRTAVDRLVVSAFATGTRADQKRAIMVSAICTTEVALWVAERSAASGSGMLTEAIAEQVIAAPYVFARLGARARFMVTVATTPNPLLVNQALTQRPSADSLDQTLNGSLHNLVLAGQVSAAGLAILGISALFSSNYGTQVILVFVILIGILFLSTWSGRRRGPTDLANGSGIGLVVVAVLAAIWGVLHLIVAVISLVIDQWGEFFHGVFFGYLETWPISIGIIIMTGLLSERLDWAFPQRPVVQMAVSAIPWQRMPATLATKRRPLVGMAILAGLLAAVLVIPLPRIKPHQVASVRGELVIGVIILFFVAAKSWDRWQLRRRMQNVDRWLSARTVRVIQAVR